MLREQALDALYKGDPIYQSHSHVNGDNLINWWTSYHALLKLVTEEGLDCLPNLQTYPENKKPPHQAVDLSTHKQRYWVIEEVRPLGVVGYKLSLVADNLGVKLCKDDLKLVPQPHQTDFSPLNKFDKNSVLLTGQSLREKLLEDFSRIVVVAQSGSQIEKRFSDQNVCEIAKEVKLADPNAFVAIASDKDLLSSLIPTMWRRLRQTPKPLETHAFPYKALQFRNELANRDFGVSVNQPIFGFDINTFCALFYAADLLIATDSYWSWLGCGMKALHTDRNGTIQSSDSVVLYTIANPDIWRVPGATAVESEGIRIQRNHTGGHFGFLSYDEYYAPQSWHPIKSSDPHRGIISEDIEKLKKAVNDILLNRSLLNSF